MNRTLLLLCVALAGCAPSVVGRNERSILIGNIDGMNDGDAFVMADTHCKGYGLHARLAGSNNWTHVNSYDCIP